MLKLAWLLLFVLAGCGGGGGGDFAPAPAQATQWELQFARNMPPHPTALGQGFYIDLPQPTAEVGSLHYVTRPVGDLSGFTKVVVDYRIDMAEGTRILPRRFPDAPSMLTLYFQREGDSMTARHEDYRWYASFATHSPITAGEHRMEARFDSNWTAVLHSTAQNNPQGYGLGLKHASRIGFVVGGGDGLGHGIYATGPARLTVTGFTLE